MSLSASELEALKARIAAQARALGFQDFGVSDVDLNDAGDKLQNWLREQYHGQMSYMQAHGSKRWRPEELVEGTLRVISVRMDYLTQDHAQMWQQIEADGAAYVSRYALGRDYHKLMRARLQKLAESIETEVGQFGYRVFVDSAPVLEKPLAEKAGLGWIAKHTNIINKDRGSWFFLGELFVDIPLPVDQPASAHCGSCSKCIDICPTQAIVAPFQLDARRCISYLTIELKTAIPQELRRGIGNRIYGCDDCQLVCPWNKFAKLSVEPDFQARHGLDKASLLELWSWTEAQFLQRTEGSAIRRIGYQSWRRNLAVGLGNAKSSAQALDALRLARDAASDLVREHIDWAIAEQQSKLIGSSLHA